MKRLLALFLLLYSTITFGQVIDGGTIGGVWISRKVPIFTGTVAADSGWAVVYLPASYAANPTKNYPVIISDHGAGQGATSEARRQSGIDLGLVLGDGLPYMITSAGIRPSAYGNDFIVIATQYIQPSAEPYYYDIFMYNYLKTQYRMDANRLYLTGYSYGGYSVMDKFTNTFDATSGNIFAAAMVQSMASPEAYRYTNMKRISTLGTPFWGMTGTSDGFFGDDKRAIDSINLGPPTPCITSVFTTRTGQGHSPSVWDSAGSPTYKPTELHGKNPFEWLYQFKVSPRCDTSIAPDFSDNDTGMIVRLSEYTHGIYIKRTGYVGNGKLSDIVGDTVSIAGMPGGIYDGSAGFHNFAFLDSALNAWTYGVDNLVGQAGNGTTSGTGYGPTKITQDSSGNPFGGDLARIYSSSTLLGPCMYVLHTNGSVHAWGNLTGGQRGIAGYPSKPYTRPVPIPVPEPIKKLAPGIVCLMLAQSGNVYTRGGGDAPSVGPYANPQGVTPIDSFTAFLQTTVSPARNIAGGYYWSLVETVSGHLYGCSYQKGYLGIGDPNNSNSGVPTATMSFVQLDSALGLVPTDFPLRDIAVNSASLYLITAKGKFMAWGDNSMGTLGNGDQLNMATYMNGATPQPYQHNQNFFPSQHFQRKPVTPLPGINMWKIYTSPFFTYNVYVKDTTGQLYVMGRNKGGPNGDGKVPCENSGNLVANFPNSWDDSTAKPVNPYTALVHVVTSPICITNPSASGCPLGSCPFVAVAPPVANAGGTLNVSTGQQFILDGTASTATSPYVVDGYKWVHISGPNGAVPLFGFPKSPMVNSVAGTDVYQLTVTDNQFQQGTITKTVITSSGVAPPTVDAGSNKTVILPLTSTVLSGSATGNGGATITSSAYTQVSGPNSATIVNGGTLTARTATVSGLIAGTYVFRLTAGDSNSNSSHSDVTVTVAAIQFILRKQGYGHKYKII